ncbi:M16 family metallopeptidase [Bdellovibrio sp. HCB2-146]|uniref:M16 family metallopeptidase n=1 Tax=Bdellovibrio sp. HCB2-146 TaxID=3394362 RepID=UPI0039BD59DD
MNKLISTLLCAFVAFQFVACASQKTTQKAPPGYVQKGNGSFQLQPYKEKTLANGLKLVFIQDSTLPRISLTMLVKTGTMQEPIAGLNALTAYLLEQGTQTRDAMRVADDFGQIGSSLDIAPGADFTTIYSDALSMDANEVLTLFSDVTMNPAFKDREINRLRSQMLAGLQKKIDNPSSFTDDEADQFLFGEHPYSRDVNGTKESLPQIRKQDIIKHYLTFYRPNNASLAVVGNISPEFENKVEEIFSKWTKRTAPDVKVTAPPAIEGLQVKLIVKKNLQQTQIRISQLGIERASADYIRVRVANETLGGGFASRLNQKVRDDLGLTYSIYSYFDTRKEKGSFEISTFTKNETAGQTLEESLKVLKDYVGTGPNETELAAAKNQLIGQFPRAIETADRLAFNILALDFYGIGIDYLTDFNKNVTAIHLKDINQTIQKHFDPTKVKVTIYGDAKIIPQFEKYKPTIERL